VLTVEPAEKGQNVSAVTDAAQRGSLYHTYRSLRSRIRTLLFGKHIYLDRVVLYRETERIIAGLPIAKMDALEISGDRLSALGFRSFRSAHYPAFDVCESPLPDAFDIVIAEQVFEHLLWPHRAAKNVFAMLKPGGYFFISTPFLQKVHDFPVDCSRWTETGLKYLLADSGFDLDSIQTWSWGNRSAVRANLKTDKFPAYFRHVSNLENQPFFPVQVWALARRR
jgi:SAM-dependent methyltransferase